MNLLALYWDALTSPDPARKLAAAAALGGIMGAIVFLARKVG